MIWNVRKPFYYLWPQDPNPIMVVILTAYCIVDLKFYTLNLLLFCSFHGGNARESNYKFNIFGWVKPNAYIGFESQQNCHLLHSFDIMIDVIVSLTRVYWHRSHNMTIVVIIYLRLTYVYLVSDQIASLAFDTTTLQSECVKSIFGFLCTCWMTDEFIINYTLIVNDVRTFDFVFFFWCHSKWFCLFANWIVCRIRDFR